MIKSLRLKGFRRYVDECFTFDDGLCFIDGENNAGKTSLFLAIEYALFGVAGAIRSPIALLHPGAAGVGVELVFVAHGKEYVLQRAHLKPPKARTKLIGHFTLKDADGRYLLSSDFQDHEDALALKLQELTGISRRVFDLAVHIRQGEVAAILDGDVKLDIALGITAASVANEELRSLALEDEQAAESLETLTASLAHVEKERASLAADDAGAKATIAALEKKLSAAEARLAALDEEAAAAGDEGGGRGAHPASASTPAAAEPGGVGRARAELESASAERADVAGRVKRRETLLSAGDATCEHCGSTLDVKRAQKELDGWKKRVVELDDVISAARAVIDAFRVEQARLEAERTAARIEREKKRARAEADIEATSEALDELRGALEEKSERLADAEREAARLRVEVEAVGKRAAHAAKLRALAGAFKELQEQLRTQAATELAEATLRIHKKLSDGDEIDELTIDPVRYQVIVTPHDAKTPMPASMAQGGGHKLLLGLAFRLALVERLGPFPFALLDEPTYGLDVKRRTALLERIASLKLSSQILLITHQSMGDVTGQRIHIERSAQTSSQRKAS